MNNTSTIHEDFIAVLSQVQNPDEDGRANYGRYATLKSCLEKIKPVLHEHGFGVMQIAHTDPDRLVTRLVHKSGEYFEDGGVPLYCADRANPQKLGSAITYARRYGLCSMLSVVGVEDDDAQSATPPNELPEPKQPKPPDQAASNQAYKNLSALMNQKQSVDVGSVVARQSWVDNHIAGMAQHRDLREHQAWSQAVKGDLKKLKTENPEELKRLEEAYLQRKNELLNRSDK